MSNISILEIGVPTCVAEDGGYPVRRMRGTGLSASAVLRNEREKQNLSVARQILEM